MVAVDHLYALRREGALLSDAADQVGLQDPVPTCPDWTIRDLLWHTGSVHRWARTIVAEPRAERPRRSEMELIAGPIPDDGLLVEWYRESHGQLVRALEQAPDDVDCYQFLDAASPLAFWKRRQAHEATIHRVDAESARGDEISPIEPEFAADGIDELLYGFHAQPYSEVRSPVAKSLQLHASDESLDEADWYLHISPEPLVTTRTPRGPVDCVLSGPVELLYLALWNRCRIDDLTVTGDAGVVKLWRKSSPISWGLPK